VQDPAPCLAGERFVKITTSTIVTVSSASVIWDMGFDRHRVLVTETLTLERIRLKGIVSDFEPYTFFFMFHNNTGLVCNECLVEHGCGGGNADFFLTSMNLVRHLPAAAWR
jgi:hypothetical protein